MLIWCKQEGDKEKFLYPEHLPLSAIQQGVKSGRFIQGTFRASRDNYLEANVSVHDEEKQVFYLLI